jgi:hypothetical protein
MLRHEPRPHTTTAIPDRELGIAAMLLLLVIVLAVALLPAFI